MDSEVLRKLDNLPTLPNVAAALMRMAAEENVQVEEVARLIEADPSTAVRLLKIVNSAYRGLQGRVSSVNRAVVMLGVNGVRNLLLSVQIVGVFGEGAASKSSRFFELWKHCLAVASAAELVAENTGGVLPEDAFTAGLLHDIGKIALYSVAREEYETVLKTVTAEHVEITEAEKAAFRVAHSEAGRYLAEKWDLPAAICSAISDHHALPAAVDFTEKVSLTAAIVAVADDLVRRRRIGFSGTPESWESLEEIFSLVGLTAENIKDIETHLVERISQRGTILDIELPESDLYMESLQKANSLLGRFNEQLQQARFTLEHSQNRLQAITDLNAALGPSFTCGDVLAGLAEAIYRHLEPAKVIAYLVREKAHTVIGSVRDSSGSAKPFQISAAKGAANDITSLGTDREALLHIVNDLGGKLDPETGLSSVAAGRLFHIPIMVDRGQRAGILVEASRSNGLCREDLQFFGEAASLVIQRALLEDRLRHESEKLVDSNRRSRGFYQQLLNSRKLAAIGRMAAGAAHEINNPLAIISGRVQLLLKMESEESKKHHLDMIRSQCDRMSRIISDILSFGKPEKPATAAVAVPEIIDSAVSLVEERAAPRQLSFVRKFPPRLPSIAADAAKIEQAFRNILANAVDASEPAGEVTITARLEEKDRFLAVSFADKGEGMDKETLENMFEPFFTTKAGVGTGLGLAITNSIIASHGGKIRARSTPGEGTVLTVLLPVWRGG